MSKIMYNDKEYYGDGIDPVTPLIDLPDYQTTGSVDKELYDGLNALGWLSECFANGKLKLKKVLAKILRTDSDWTTISSNSGAVKYKIIRGFVWIHIDKVSPTTSWSDLCTIPESIRPPSYYYGKGCNGSSAKYAMTMYINANGTIRISTTNASSNDGYGTIIYPLVG